MEAAAGDEVQQATTSSTTALRLRLVVSHTAGADPEALSDFARQLAADASPVLGDATGLEWRSTMDRPRPLDGDQARPASDFLDVALLTMVRTPADVVVVVTDAPLMSARQTLVPGLASPAANIVVLSTSKLIRTPFGRQLRTLDEPAVRWNAVTLLVHLVGHLLELPHGSSGAMREFSFEESRKEVARLDVDQCTAARAARQLIEHEQQAATPWRRAATQFEMTLRRPRAALTPIVRSRAPLLPFRLGKLSAAAVAPALIILFTDEYWWAAIHLQAWAIWLSALVAVLGGTVFLLRSQRLLFPHRDSTVTTRHVALVNAAISMTTLLLMTGLLATVTLAVLAVELLLFPPGYLEGWFDGRFAVGLDDHFHLALVVGTAGAVSGALGGSAHGRALLREYGLFLDEP